jgi:hypothetical protein
VGIKFVFQITGTYLLNVGHTVWLETEAETSDLQSKNFDVPVCD